ncbi:sulfoxide reductase heme-binding subunit YedZ [Mitsuaria sp. TWR114]|jgi:sulfoxide reductase heme-binding subunit YedZ|uniref:sulfite oxidase heme-binding subunit YedZ n=1 Tax=unclassified Roseateles TaxID=2626991 RepID=UPI0008E5F695|nr:MULTISPECIES: protein-methionine-sulfoxide reductase heme-binding subunit MsrQ [unclassified Roseateles]MBB3284508.1 sulfoxide reductase heme-binding subunit YedZ [Mitsuaria sp. BK037]TXE00173.1 sulfoxide reductase heme-binding subunit YedZ [Mitsuaria sp. TWR114]SFR70928.1 sulfoxide reductase heme-binding subunit YedZ [Mitsuaria sp. PDC51]
MTSVPPSTAATSTSATAPAAARRAPARRHPLLHPAAKVVLFLLCLLPLAWYVFGAFTERLGANPAETLIRGLGDWALRLLWITLAVTPLRTWTNQPALARFRRMLGLFAFFYASLHLLAYGWLDKGLDLADILRDIGKRPFILMGFTAWLLLVPLAATSFNRAIKALGAPRWQALHKLVYAIAIVGLMHFIWMRAGKNNFAEPLVYGSILAVLLGWRAFRRMKR